MNAQPNDLLSFLVLVSLIIFGAIHYCVALFGHSKKASKSFDYMIPIGVIQPVETKVQPTAKPNSSRPNSINAAFLSDCISALVNLGFKKKEATSLSIDIINSKKPSSVEEFIRLVFTK